MLLLETYTIPLSYNTEFSVCLNECLSCRHLLRHACRLFKCQKEYSQDVNATFVKVCEVYLMSTWDDCTRLYYNINRCVLCQKLCFERVLLQNVGRYCKILKLLYFSGFIDIPLLGIILKKGLSINSNAPSIVGRFPIPIFIIQVFPMIFFCADCQWRQNNYEINYLEVVFRFLL